MSEVLRLEYVDGVMHFKTSDDDAVELVEGDEYCSAISLDLLSRELQLSRNARDSLVAQNERLSQAIEWCLSVGASSSSDGDSVYGEGCGCCEECITPPDDIASVIEYAKQRTRVRKP